MAEQITITISNDIYQQIETRARQDRKNVLDVVSELVNNTFSPRKVARNPAREQMLQEVQAYKRLHPALVKTHLGQFVAIYQGQLVDHDRDKDALFWRIKENFPDQIVLQREVTINPDPVLHFRSPRLIQE